MELDKKIQTEYLTASGLVCAKPCWLFAVIAGSTQTTAKVLTIRDGSVVTDDIKMKLYCSVYNNPAVVFAMPVYFKKGLYLEFATNVDFAFVQYTTEY